MKSAKLVYTYSHTISSTDYLPTTTLSTILRYNLHNQWLQSPSLSLSTKVGSGSLPLRCRRISVLSQDTISNTHLFLTTTSYSRNPLTLTTLDITLTPKGFTPRPGRGVAKKAFDILRLFDFTLNTTLLRRVGTHFLYTLFFTSRNYHSLAVFNKLLAKTTRSPNSTKSFSPLFHNMKNL